MKLQSTIVGILSPIAGALCTIQYLSTHPGHGTRALGVGVLVVIVGLGMSYVIDTGADERGN